jgi:hypothetical protein
MQQEGGVVSSAPATSVQDIAQSPLEKKQRVDDATSRSDSAHASPSTVAQTADEEDGEDKVEEEEEASVDPWLDKMLWGFPWIAEEGTYGYERKREQEEAYELYKRSKDWKRAGSNFVATLTSEEVMLHRKLAPLQDIPFTNALVCCRCVARLKRASSMTNHIAPRF